jgi:hypothetical protein
MNDSGAKQVNKAGAAAVAAARVNANIQMAQT